jgi:hypothetical protein
MVGSVVAGMVGSGEGIWSAAGGDMARGAAPIGGLTVLIELVRGGLVMVTGAPGSLSMPGGSFETLAWTDPASCQRFFLVRPAAAMMPAYFSDTAFWSNALHFAALSHVPWHEGQGEWMNLQSVLEHDAVTLSIDMQ